MNKELDIELLATDTLHGDLTSAIVEELQNLPEVWEKLSESKQKAIIDRATGKSEFMIKQAVHQISQKGFTSTTATVDSVTFKGGVKTVLNTHNNTGAHELADREGSTVTIVFADPEEYLNGGVMPEAEPDQMELVS